MLRVVRDKLLSVCHARYDRRTNCQLAVAAKDVGIVAPSFCKGVVSCAIYCMQRAAIFVQ